MIDKKLRRDDLIGRKCRSSIPLINGKGEGVSEKTICTIVDVVRGKGIRIRTEKCPYCGQFGDIHAVPREKLDLIEEES